jgi:hypothetical protein
VRGMEPEVLGPPVDGVDHCAQTRALDPAGALWLSLGGQRVPVRVKCWRACRLHGTMK